jgi:hypothetical protein
MKPSTAIIDADELAFKIALKYQRSVFKVFLNDKEISIHRTKTDAIESILSSTDNYEIREEVSKIPVDSFSDIIDSSIYQILSNTNTSEYILCLSGDNNFRYSLATLLPYKGNRKQDKPLYLEEIKEAMLWKQAEKVDHLEADDLLRIKSIELDGKGVICSSDKDLLQVEGWNYNIGKKALRKISESEARFNFYYQLLIGDVTDNIPSPYRLGVKAASDFLINLKDISEKNVFERLVPFYSKYLKSLDKDGKYKTSWYDGRDVLEVLYEVGNLIYMHKTINEDERWKLPI